MLKLSYKDQKKENNRLLYLCKASIKRIHNTDMFLHPKSLVATVFKVSPLTDLCVVICMPLWVSKISRKQKTCSRNREASILGELEAFECFYLV